MAIWRVSTYYKKSCEEHEYYTKGDQTIIRQTGFRWGSFQVETSDDNPPEFEFDYVPGGNGAKDSINMYDSYVNNIENIELISMDDGCWEEIVWPEDMDEEEQETLQERFYESSIYEVLEGEEGWNQNDTEAWVWGPILIEDDHGNRVRIICADEDGNVIDYVEDEPSEIEELSFAEQDALAGGNAEQDVINSMPVWPFPDTKDK